MRWVRLWFIAYVAIDIERTMQPVGPLYTLVSLIGLLIAVWFVFVSLSRPRALRRATVRRTATPATTPEAIVEQCFAALVDARMAYDAAVAVVVRDRTFICFPGRDAGSSELLYEVGSLTKPMTGALLASMILDGTVDATASLGHLLPGALLPADVAAITLEQLATHRSGLPRLPRSPRFLLGAFLGDDPYRYITSEKLIDYLRRARRTTPLGTYSNFGFGTLGYALGQRDGGGYARAMAARVFEPLGMRDTHVDPPAALDGRFARGHDRLGARAGRWHMSAVAGAGGACMTIGDALLWLNAHVHPSDDFREIINVATRPHADFGGDRIGFGWIVRRTEEGSMIWHNGGTAGFSGFAVFDPDREIGLIALTASAHAPALDRAGLRAFDLLVKGTTVSVV